MPKAKTKPTKVRYFPIVNLPPLPPDQASGLRDSIAVHGVLLPIAVDSDGPKRGIIDGIHRKKYADEFGYDCPKIVIPNLDEQEKRVLARALNLARRQLNTDQKRQIIADQLRETPEYTDRRVAKMLGVSHPTVASVRLELSSVGKVFQQDFRVGEDGKQYRSAHKPLKSVARSAAERKARVTATTLIHGDCTKELRKINSKSIDCVITDPIYPEVNRPYGRISEDKWHCMMRTVVTECRRVLKRNGSMVVILQPNNDRVGKMRLWLWEFLLWAAKEWNLIQDVYWWCVNTPPTHAASRRVGLMRQSVKMICWFGPPDSYRNQDAVLWEQSDAMAAVKWSDRCLRRLPSSQTIRPGRVAEATFERGGSTPFNILPIPSTHPVDHCGHPASTPYALAAWWCRYILPENGVLLDPFAGSGTMLLAGLDHGASRVIGIEKERRYLETAKRRIRSG